MTMFFTQQSLGLFAKLARKNASLYYRVLYILQVLHKYLEPSLSLNLKPLISIKTAKSKKH